MRSPCFKLPSLAVALLTASAGLAAPAAGAWLFGNSDPVKESPVLQSPWVAAGDAPALKRLGVAAVRNGPAAPIVSADAPVRIGKVVAEPVAAFGEGAGFTLTAPADRSERVLRFHVSHTHGQLLVKARVTGGGAHFFTYHSRGRDLPGARVFTLNYAAARDGEQLVVEAETMIARQDDAAVALWAVATERVRRNQPPAVRIITPRTRSEFTMPAKIVVEAEASDPDDGVAKVAFFDLSLALPLGEVHTPPYRLEIDRPVDWVGSFTARAIDRHGRETESEPVRYTVVDPADKPGPIRAPLFSAHVSTGLPGTGWEGVTSLAELPDGDLYVVWYGGKYELSTESRIYASRFTTATNTWSTPRPIIPLPNQVVGNPVLLWHDDALWCFFLKVYGESWEFAKLYLRKSRDLGETWGEEVALPEPHFRYPTGTLVATRPLVLRNGDILLPLNREVYHPEAWKGWYSLFMISSDGGATWRETAPLYSRPGNIQPAVEQLDDGSLVAFLRPRGQGSNLWISRSRDNGRTWDPLTQTDLPNPSSRPALGRLKNGDLVMAHNDHPRRRTPLNLSLSNDGGRTWRVSHAIESGGHAYTYPTLLVTRDDRIHVAYDDNRRAIKHAVVDAAWFDR